MTSAATTAVRRGRRTTPPAAWMTERNLARGRQLWDDGVTATDIAGALGKGCTKSALLGYAHRQGWPPRPSPLGPRKGEVVPRVPPRPHHRGAPTPRKRPQNAPEELRMPVRPQALAVPTLSFGRCQFIEGDDRKSWKMCGCETVPGTAWCPTHKAICYCRPPRWDRLAA